MKTVDDFKAIIKERPTGNYYENERKLWDYDISILRDELRKAYNAALEVESIQRELQKQARRVAQLEFDNARLTELIALRPPTLEIE